MKRWLITVGCFLLAGSGTPAAPDQLTEEDRRCLVWFDTLGFPDLGKCKFVKVAAGMTGEYPDGHRENSYMQAMLLKDMGKRFEVFTFSLATRTYEKTGPGTPEYARVGYEVQDLGKEVAAQLKTLHDEDAIGDDFPQTLPDLEYGIRNGQKLVMARACTGHHVDAIAHQVLELARECQSGDQKSLCDSFADDFAARSTSRRKHISNESQEQRHNLASSIN